MLDELVGVIETLKARIGAHRETLQANETRTRVALIDPLLCALGWNTADPSLVALEYDVRGKKADYAFWGPNDRTRPLLVLEAKRLGESLSNHRRQMALYAFDEGILYPALTNGDQWEVYDYTEMGSREERRVLHLSIADDPAPQIALQLLLLWRANMTSGNPQQAPEPIVDANPVQSPKPTPPKPPLLEDNVGWTRLTDFEAVPGSKVPPTMRFSNGEQKPMNNWRSVLIEAAEWLVRKGVLSDSDSPVRSMKRAFYYVSNRPIHNDGRDFRTFHKLSNGLFLNTHGNSSAMVGRSRSLAKKLGQDPSQVWLKTG